MIIRLCKRVNAFPKGANVFAELPHYNSWLLHWVAQRLKTRLVGAQDVHDIMGAGHETTASTAAAALWAIAAHPHAEARVHAELDNVLGAQTNRLRSKLIRRHATLLVGATVIARAQKSWSACSVRKDLALWLSAEYFGSSQCAAASGSASDIHVEH